MDAVACIEMTLDAALAPDSGLAGPPRLAAAMRHAVFPGGARVRPRLCLAVARACGHGDDPLAHAAAASLELIHCASLVHDDLPCFDNAELRRGLPSVHQLFGDSIAVLAGDALIVLAFETLAKAAAKAAARTATRAAAGSNALANLVLLLSRSTGMPRGIIAGQAWECEADIPVAAYHRAKTASLFSAATMAGALAAGHDAAPWHMLGERLGEAYQIADDIRDVVASAAQLGKPAGRDQALGRPSIALQQGVPAAMLRLGALITDAIAAIPPCPLASDLRRLIHLEVQRLLPREMLEREVAGREMLAGEMLASEAA